MHDRCFPESDLRLLMELAANELAGLPQGSEGSMLVVSREAVHDAAREYFSRPQAYTAATIDDALGSGLRATLALVIDQLEDLPEDAAMALLARLRDCHCDRILVHTFSGSPGAQEMLALGFIAEDWAGEGRLFAYRRDEFFEARTWNSPEKWAHPENFRKYRW